MRGAILLACCIGLAQPIFAAGPSHGYIKLSKPGISYAAFLDDRSACLNQASHRRYGLPTVLKTKYDLYGFADCMTAKGYRLDPTGYRAAWFTSYDGKHFTLLPDGPRV